jgi:hypothetical protein
LRAKEYDSQEHTQGTGNPNVRYEDRAVAELENLARACDIEG